MNAVATPNVNLVGITGIARRLVQDGALDETAAREAMTRAGEAKVPLAQWLAEKKLVSAGAMAAANSVEFGMPVIDATAFDPTHNAMKLVSEELVQKHNVLPLFKRGSKLFVGTSNPTQTAHLAEIQFHTNLVVEPILVDEEQIRRVLEQWQNLSGQISGDLGSDDEEGLDNLEASIGDEDAGSESGVDAKGDDTPVVKFVNKVLIDAIRRGASDIHFEPYETDYRVRLRIDGLLKSVAKAPVKLSPRIAARLKVMAQLDIAEKRVPQDGRIKLNLSKTKQIDFRVSTLPTLFGEKIVLRILDGSAAKLGIDKLGYEPDQQKLFEEAIQKPYGMVLVTGPTGSGKTVSLYTALGILNDEVRNISTVEDPVEINLPGVNQVQMDERTGMTFAKALKAFLRQDPDVILVGEIRDFETGSIAVKAAQTGHLVLSTLHTNDAPQTLTRLVDMGVQPFAVATAVNVIIGQRLARRLCPHCKAPVDIPRDGLLAEGFPQEDVESGMTVFRAVGCDRCNEGYKGRVGIYQVMPVSEGMRRLIMENRNAMELADQARREGIRDIRQSGLLKVRNGITSLEEINRVTLE